MPIFMIMATAVIYVLTIAFALAIGLTVYIVTAVAVTRMGRTTGSEHPYLAWIPVVNVFALGRIADNIREREGSGSRLRIVLLVLQIVEILFSLLIGGVYTSYLLSRIGMDDSINSFLDAGLSVIGPALALYFALMGVALAYTVVFYVTLYRIYAAYSPDNAVILLVLSIFISVATPFVLLVLSKKTPAVFLSPLQEDSTYTSYTFTE